MHGNDIHKCAPTCAHRRSYRLMCLLIISPSGGAVRSQAAHDYQ